MKRVPENFETVINEVNKKVASKWSYIRDNGLDQSICLTYSAWRPFYENTLWREKTEEFYQIARNLIKIKK